MKNIIPILIICMMTVSCSSVRYMSDNLNPNDPTLRGSYSIEGDCEKEVSKVFKIRVSNAIHSFMREQGLEKSDSPDMLIQFLIKEESNSFLTEECDYYGRWGQGERCRLMAVNYREGSIVIDIIDTKTQNIVWHGVVICPPMNYLNNPNEEINKYVHKLLSRYYQNN